MPILLTVIHVVICFVLIAVILLQAGRGQGLSGSNFASSNVQSLFGTRAADFLTKATTVSAVLFLFTCIGLDMLEARRGRSLFDTGQPAAPVDVKQIEDVLAKIKAEEQKTAAQEPAPEAASTAVPAEPGTGTESKSAPPSQ